jgi:hypothetical protein
VHVSRLYLLLVLAAACSFDPNTTSESSTAGPDAAIPTVGANLDASAADQEARDGGNMPTDEKGDAGFDAVPVTCDKMYGAADSFDLCEETSNSCRFYVMTNEDTCTNLCGSFGGTCIDNYDGNCGSGIGSQGCNVVHFDQVCICSKPEVSVVPIP